MHTFNRDYSQVSSSASESKVSPCPNPLIRPVIPSETLSDQGLLSILFYLFIYVLIIS